VVVEEKRENSTFVMACKVAGDHVGGAFKLRQKTAKEMHHPKLNHANLATLKWSYDSTNIVSTILKSIQHQLTTMHFTTSYNPTNTISGILNQLNIN